MAIPFKSTLFTHHVVERTLSAMTKRRMSEIVAKTDSLDEVEVRKRFFLTIWKTLITKLEYNSVGDLSHLHGMCQPRPVEIPFPNAQNLCFRLQAAE